MPTPGEGGGLGWDGGRQSPKELQASVILSRAGQQQQVWEFQGWTGGCHPHCDLVGDFS